MAQWYPRCQGIYKFVHTVSYKKSGPLQVITFVCGMAIVHSVIVFSWKALNCMYPKTSSLVCLHLLIESLHRFKLRQKVYCHQGRMFNTYDANSMSETEFPMPDDCSGIKELQVSVFFKIKWNHNWRYFSFLVFYHHKYYLDKHTSSPTQKFFLHMLHRKPENVECCESVYPFLLGNFWNQIVSINVIKFICHICKLSSQKKIGLVHAMRSNGPHPQVYLGVVFTDVLVLIWKA